MGKEKKYIKIRKKLYFLLFLIVIIGLGIMLYKFLTPYYKIESRVDEVKKFTGVEKEKAIGWLRVQGTNIDLPIVYYYNSDVSDPTYNLGWSFSDNNQHAKKITLFSHNVLNVSSQPLIADKSHQRFEQLLSYIYTSFVKENQYIQYTVGGKDYLYKIYAISFQKEADLDYETDNPSQEQVKTYIKNAKENSYFNFDIDVDENDHLITLVTCTRFFGSTTDYSFVVDARQVREKERINKCAVKEKDSYKEIKKVLEGDDKDEA